MMKNMKQRHCLGVRGAVDVAANDPQSIENATHHLLTQMMQCNRITIRDIAAIYFTLTPDLNASFPASAARTMGLTQVPMLCAQEIPVPGSLPCCLRILLLWNSTRNTTEIVHCYLGAAQTLRPDLCQTEVCPC